MVIGLVTLLLLTIGFVYVNNFTLMHQLPGWTRYFDQPHGVLLNLADRTLWPRYLHFMLSAPAIGGLALALYHAWRQRRGAEDAEVQIRRGCRWFTHATLVNVAVGLWFTAVLPKGVLTLSTPTGLWLTLTIVAGLVATDETDERALLTVTRNGYGKRTPLSEYSRQSRYGKGLIDIKTDGPATWKVLHETLARYREILREEIGKTVAESVPWWPPQPCCRPVAAAPPRWTPSRRIASSPSATNSVRSPATDASGRSTPTTAPARHSTASSTRCGSRPWPTSTA